MKAIVLVLCFYLSVDSTQVFASGSSSSVSGENNTRAAKVPLTTEETRQDPLNNLKSRNTLFSESVTEQLFDQYIETVQEENLPKVEELLKKQVHRYDRLGLALFYACMNGNEPLMLLLLQAGYCPTHIHFFALGRSCSASHKDSNPKNHRKMIVEDWFHRLIKFAPMLHSSLGAPLAPKIQSIFDSSLKNLFKTLVTTPRNKEYLDSFLSGALFDPDDVADHQLFFQEISESFSVDFEDEIQETLLHWSAYLDQKQSDDFRNEAEGEQSSGSSDFSLVRRFQSLFSLDSEGKTDSKRSTDRVVKKKLL